MAESRTLDNYPFLPGPSSLSSRKRSLDVSTQSSCSFLLSLLSYTGPQGWLAPPRLHHAAKELFYDLTKPLTLPTT